MTEILPQADHATAILRTEIDSTALTEFSEIMDTMAPLGETKLKRALLPFIEAQGWHDLFLPNNRLQFQSRLTAIRVWHSKIAYQAHRLAQLRNGNFKFWVYKVCDCSDHAQFDGLTLEPDHIFWQTHFPANGVFCRCHVSGAMREASIVRVGGNPELKLASTWDKLDPATGLPFGIQVGFGCDVHPDLAAGLLALQEGIGNHFIAI